MERGDGVCIEMTEIVSIPKEKDSPLNASFLESSSVTNNVLQYLSLSDVKNLMFTNKANYKTTVQSLDWKNRVSELFYPCGYEFVKDADSPVLMERQMNVYNKQKSTADSLYYLIKMYWPLFRKYKRRTSILQIVYLFLIMLCILTLICHVLHSSWVYREEGFIPVFLIVHLVSLYILYALTYLISSSISTRIDCDLFYYHLGKALYLPKFLYYGFPVYPHVALIIILYTVHYGLWYLYYVGYLLQSTCSVLDACLCYILIITGHWYWGYISKTSTKLVRKFTDDYFTSVLTVLYIVGVLCLLYWLFYNDGNWVFFVFAIAPYAVLIYLMITDGPENRLFHTIFIGIATPYAVYWILLFISYNWVYNNKFWTDLILSFYTLAILGFAGYFAYVSVKGFHDIIEKKSFYYYITLCVNRIPESLFIHRTESLFPMEGDFDYDTVVLDEASFLKVVNDIVNSSVTEMIMESSDDDDDEFTVTSTETDEENNPPNQNDDPPVTINIPRVTLPVPNYFTPVNSPVLNDDLSVFRPDELIRPAVDDVTEFREMIRTIDSIRAMMQDTMRELDGPVGNETMLRFDAFSVD